MCKTVYDKLCTQAGKHTGRDADEQEYGKIAHKCRRPGYENGHTQLTDVVKYCADYAAQPKLPQGENPPTWQHGQIAQHTSGETVKHGAWLSGEHSTEHDARQQDGQRIRRAVGEHGIDGDDIGKAQLDPRYGGEGRKLHFDGKENKRKRSEQRKPG